MAIGVRLGVWCAGAAVACLSLAPYAAAGTPQELLEPAAAPSAFGSRAADNSLTVAWIAREGAIRGYAVRVACAPDRLACPAREWFVERHGGAELSSYVVRVRVPAGATIVRVGLEAVDQKGRRVPVAERYVPQAPERLHSARLADEASRATLGACVGAGSLVAPRLVFLASPEQCYRAVPPTDGAFGAHVPLLLSSRGPPAVTRARS